MPWHRGCQNHVQVVALSSHGAPALDFAAPAHGFQLRPEIVRRHTEPLAHLAEPDGHPRFQDSLDPLLYPFSRLD